MSIRPSSKLRPVLGVPAVVLPDHVVPHDELVSLIRGRYDTALLPTVAAADRDKVARDIATAARMSSRLAIERHHYVSPLAEIMEPRGFAERNARSVAAVRDTVPAAVTEALRNADMRAADIGAIVIAHSTSMAMPPLGYQLLEELGIPRTADVIPLQGMGCTGGGHAIGRAWEYARARPDRAVLVVTADFASPWFYVENYRDRRLVGSIVSAGLFTDAAAAAVMSTELPATGFRIRDVASIYVPGTANAIAWDVQDDGLHFALTDKGVKSIPGVVSALHTLLDDAGWRSTELAPCAFHTGGNRIMDDVQKSIGLDDWQMGPARDCFRVGNTMSAAVLDTLRLIATDERYRPPPDAPGLGAGYGPGFSAAAFSWEFHEST